MIEPVAGYLGAVAVFPVTTLTDLLESLRSVLAIAICLGLAFINNKFRLFDVLIERGQQRLAVIEETGLNVATAFAFAYGRESAKVGVRSKYSSSNIL